MQEIKSLKNKISELKRSAEFTQDNLEERVHNVKENMFKVKGRPEGYLRVSN